MIQRPTTPQFSLPPSPPLTPFPLSYTSCPHLSLHTGQPLNSLCIDPLCANKGLICAICSSTNHHNHKTILIRQFIEMIAGDKKAYFQGFAKGIQRVADAKRKAWQLVRDKKKEVEKELEEMERAIEGYIRRLDEEVQQVMARERYWMKVMDEIKAFSSQDQTKQLQIKEKLSIILQTMSHSIYFTNSNVSVNSQLQIIENHAMSKINVMEDNFGRMMERVKKTKERVARVNESMFPSVHENLREDLRGKMYEKIGIEWKGRKVVEEKVKGEKEEQHGK